MKNVSKTRNVMILLLTDIVWGIAFVAQSKGGDAVGAYSFNGIRFLIGAAVLLPVIKIMDKMELTTNRPRTADDRKTLWTGGICCGLALCLASNLQQLGITMGAEAGKAGFLTATYILMVPILGLFIGRKCNIKIWIGVAITLVGMYFLCMNGREGFFSLQKSDILLLLCALCFAIQILFIDHFSPKVDAARLSCIEFLVTGVCSCIPMFFVDMGHSMSGIVQWTSALTDWSAWIPILYAGIFSSGIGYTLQVVGQKGLNPAFASMVMSLESVVSVFAGWILLGQQLSAREIIGCVLIFVAIMLAQIPDKKYTS